MRKENIEDIKNAIILGTNKPFSSETIEKAIRETALYFEGLLIQNSQISFDNQSIIFNRGWFWKNIEKEQEK